jgi:hypothetical protein
VLFGFVVAKMREACQMLPTKARSKLEQHKHPLISLETPGVCVDVSHDVQAIFFEQKYASLQEIFPKY